MDDRAHSGYICSVTRLRFLLGILAFLIGALLIWGLCEDVVRRKLLFVGDRLILTSSISLFSKTRVVPLPSIEQFGYGEFSHSRIPVLMFDVKNKWTVLATNVARADVDALLQQISSEGIVLPPSR